MKNLAPYVVSRLLTGDQVPFPLQKFIFVEDLVVACFCGGGMAAVGLWSPTQFWHDQVEWPLSDESDEVMGLHYDSIDRKVVVAFKSGDFVEVRNGEAAVVGSLDTPISNCEWSPAGDLAFVVCTSGKVLVLSTDFDLGPDVMVGEHQISLDDLKLAESHVSVGWGKKETQFQGRGARALSKDPTVAAQVDTRDLDTEKDDLQTTVSWRGDGSVVVVNSCFGNQRALRVFTHEGKLESVSEPAAKLLGLCAYEPRGALIATVTGNSKLQFFERNGLKRYSFDLDPEHTPLQLAWSSDSSILSILYESKVELWTQKNWHWYRKQVVEGEYDRIEWHPELPKTMGLRTSDEITFFTWQFTTASDQGLVAVIDTNEIKVTPLSVAGIPPPMAFASLKFDEQPRAVAVRAPTTIAVALATQVVVLNLDIDQGILETLATHEVAGVQLLALDDNARLLGYKPEVNEIIDIENLSSVATPESPVSVLKGSHCLCGNQVFRLEGMQPVSQFTEPCTDFVTAASGESFGLTRSGKLLHSTGKVLAHGVTSILAGPDHLLYTTLTTLRFVHFGAPLTETTEAAKAATEQSREIERGSQLVTIMSEQMAVVLQAPRGNIETIYPRMLVLGVVRSNVAELNYADAFQACKTHRIDIGLLYDLNPTQWKANIPLFVSQLGSDANIGLFLSSLSDEDVSKTKYVDTSVATTSVATTVESASTSIPGKANSVLDLIIPHVSPTSQITALAMKQPPALTEALQKASSSPALVKHLVFLSDADLLYRTALGVYEYKLALVVAQQAQMDPKEYLPFLKARSKESEPRSKFNIDVYLRRNDLAIEHLIADPEATEDEITNFALKHDLQAEALRILRQTKSERKQALNDILLSQAELWLAQSKYVEAGTNFELLGEVSRACDCYVQGCNWRRALALPVENEEQRIKIVERLVDACETNKHYQDCAHLLLHYLNDPRRALSFFCQGDRFDDAVLLAVLHPDLHDYLDDKLRESFGLFQELLSDCSSQVPSQLKRLRAIRAKRQEDMLGFDKLANQLEAADLDAADNLSLAGTEASGTTNASAYTRYTDKSSVGTANTNATRRTLKNQRRQDRKKARGKKGSVYEEDYLISSTGRLVDRLQSTRAEIQELVAALRRRNLELYATQLVSAFEHVYSLLEENLDEIYNVDEEALVRFDESGHEYIAARPTKPALPELLA